MAHKAIWRKKPYDRFAEIYDAVVQAIEQVNDVYTELSAQNLNPRTNLFTMTRPFSTTTERASVSQVLPEIRIEVSPTRFRVADVAVWRPGPIGERIPTIPPFLVVEILSLEDRVVRLQPKIREYWTQHPDLNIQLADLLSALD